MISLIAHNGKSMSVYYMYMYLDKFDWNITIHLKTKFWKQFALCHTSESENSYNNIISMKLNTSFSILKLYISLTKLYLNVSLRVLWSTVCMYVNSESNCLPWIFLFFSDCRTKAGTTLFVLHIDDISIIYNQTGCKDLLKVLMVYRRSIVNSKWFSGEWDSHFEVYGGRVDLLYIINHIIRT